MAIKILVRQGKMLSSLEAFGYEVGMIIRASIFLFAIELFYVFCCLFFSVPGPTYLWLLIMYFLATVLTIANDIHFFNGNLLQLDQIPMHVRTGVDFALYFLFQQFLRVGDVRVPQKSLKIAKNFVDTLGKPTSSIFFLTALHLSNCAFLAAVRFIMNGILSVTLAVQSFVHWFFGTRPTENE